MRIWIGPGLLIGLAALLLAVELLRPDPDIDLGPIDLRNGATRTVTLTPGFNEGYEIGVRMDHAVAARLFPCNVELTCGPGPHPWPASLDVTVVAAGESLRFERSRATAGGTYFGDTYFWSAGSVPLTRGVAYRVTVRSIADGSPLEPARPHLMARVMKGGFGEELIIQRFITLVGVGVLLLLALGWGVFGWFRARKRV
jgi:hypothetical protein